MSIIIIRDVKMLESDKLDPGMTLGSGAAKHKISKGSMPMSSKSLAFALYESLPALPYNAPFKLHYS